MDRNNFICSNLYDCIPTKYTTQTGTEVSTDTKIKLGGDGGKGTRGGSGSYCIDYSDIYIRKIS